MQKKTSTAINSQSFENQGGSPIFVYTYSDNGLPAAEVGQRPVDVLEVDLSGPEGAAASAGDDSCWGGNSVGETEGQTGVSSGVSSGEGTGVSAVVSSGVSAVVGVVVVLLGADLGGEVLWVADFIHAGNNINFE